MNSRRKKGRGWKERRDACETWREDGKQKEGKEKLEGKESIAGNLEEGKRSCRGKGARKKGKVKRMSRGWCPYSDDNVLTNPRMNKGAKALLHHLFGLTSNSVPPKTETKATTHSTSERNNNTRSTCPLAEYRLLSATSERRSKCWEQVFLPPF